MSESEMKTMIKWLDADKNPLLLQGTEKVVKTLWKKIKSSK